MAKQPEGKLVKKILIRLRSHGGWWIKVHGGRFQAAGLPDIIGCYKGRFVGIEVKVPGKEDTLTPIQKHTLNSIETTGGGYARMVTNEADAMEILEVIDKVDRITDTMF